MKLASVTVTSSRASIIGDAIRSVVDQVDMVLIIDLGITDDTVEVARSVAGDKVVVSKYPGGGQFSDMRNFGLTEAHRLGADWAVILDTDERINWNGVPIRDVLAQAGDGIGLVEFSEGTYSKEKFVSLPAKDFWNGTDVHECIIPTNSKQFLVQGMTFDELEKSHDVMRGKLEYLLGHLQGMCEEDKDNPRWHYYLGDTLAGLGRKEEAIKAFDKCASMRGWDEESAWACFRMAILLQEQGRYQDALDICCCGLSRYPAAAELCWLAGEMALRLGNFDHAIYWGRMAVANGVNSGTSHLIKPRVGFKYPYGTKEGPYKLMQEAYNKLGMHDHSAKCAKVVDMLLGGSNGENG